MNLWVDTMEWHCHEGHDSVGHVFVTRATLHNGELDKAAKGEQYTIHTSCYMHLVYVPSLSQLLLCRWHHGTSECYLLFTPFCNGLIARMCRTIFPAFIPDGLMFVYYCFGQRPVVFNS